jgi:hypothetical protein
MTREENNDDEKRGRGKTTIAKKEGVLGRIIDKE